MKTTAAACLIIVTGVFATAAFGACEVPSVPDSIPDGATSTEEQLLAVQTEVESYIAAMDEYIACTNDELTTAGPDATSEYLHLMSMRIDNARTEAEAIATQFNDQVVAFRAANQRRSPASNRPAGQFPGQNPLQR